MTQHALKTYAQSIEEFAEKLLVRGDFENGLDRLDTALDLYQTGNMQEDVQRIQRRIDEAEKQQDMAQA